MLLLVFDYLVMVSLSNLKKQNSHILRQYGTFQSIFDEFSSCVFIFFFGIILSLKDPRHKIHETFEILFQICVDNWIFRSLGIFAEGTQISSVLCQKNAEFNLALSSQLHVSSLSCASSAKTEWKISVCSDSAKLNKALTAKMRSETVCFWQPSS